jgi:hypothetical protein
MNKIEIIDVLGVVFFLNKAIKIKVYCKQNRHFYQDFFLGIPDFFNFILV